MKVGVCHERNKKIKRKHKRKMPAFADFGLLRAIHFKDFCKFRVKPERNLFAS